MKTKSQSIHDSFWLKGSPLKQKHDSLDGNHQTDVLIIGGGISGLSVALELLETGQNVTVCEAAVIGAGTTGGSSGHLDAHPEMGPQELINSLGESKAREYTRLRIEAIDAIEKRSDNNSDFVRLPAYYYTDNADDCETLKEQHEAANKIGLTTQWLGELPFPGAKCGYRIANMGRMNSLAYLRHLADLVVEQGGTIFENTIVSGPTGDKPTSLKAGKGKVSFNKVVCAVHCNYTDAMRIYLQTPAYQSYIIAAEVEDEIEDALFWDNSHPYYYTRRANSEQPHLILVGGCDHRTGAGDESLAIDKLSEYLRRRFQVKKIVSTWSAEFFEPSDGMPLIGKVPGKENVWIATGLSGVGLTWGTAAGKMIAELICTGKTSLQDELSPARFGLAGAVSIIGEQAITAANLAERILPAKQVDPSRLKPGEGTVGNVDGEHVAICRDRDGCEHRHSPICTHMGGVVHWNEVEQTWDCPVHGGRFAANGERLYGPPEEKLKKPDRDE